MDPKQGGRQIPNFQLYFWSCSRAATKFSRSMAVTTPNTICRSLAWPLLWSERGKQGRRIKGAWAWSWSEADAHRPRPVGGQPGQGGSQAPSMASGLGLWSLCMVLLRPEPVGRVRAAPPTSPVYTAAQDGQSQPCSPEQTAQEGVTSQPVPTGHAWPHCVRTRFGCTSTARVLAWNPGPVNCEQLTAHPA